MPRRNNQRPIRAKLPDPSCSYKKLYASRDLAQKAIQQQENFTGDFDQLDQYYCHRCKGWHLTSKAS